MSDDRPKPEYGEYATPEEQAAAMGQSHVAAPSEPTGSSATRSAPTSGFTGTSGRVLAPTYLERQPGWANRFITVFLLGFGALSLIGDAPLYVSLGSALKGAYSSAGLNITVPAAVNSAGIPALIANILIYAATVFVSVLAMRRGRVSFYIPIVGFILFVVVFAFIVLAVAPGFAAQLQ